MTTIRFILSAISIGFASTLIEWVIIGSLFHKYQALTPKTWRPESSKSYMYSTMLSLLFGVLFTLFYCKVGQHYVLRGGLLSHIKLGLICFGCFSLVSGINSAVYVNFDKRFTAGLLIASCLTYCAASVIGGLYLGR